MKVTIFGENVIIRKLLRTFLVKKMLEIPMFIWLKLKKITNKCQLHPESSVHLLEKEKPRKLLWQQSQRSLETVHRYIDSKSSHTYTGDDLDKLLQQAQHQKVMLISDTAGMGKSTTLTHLSKQIKQKFPNKWVVRIDLNDRPHRRNETKTDRQEKGSRFRVNKTAEP